MCASYSHTPQFLDGGDGTITSADGTVIVGLEAASDGHGASMNGGHGHFTDEEVKMHEVIYY